MSDTETVFFSIDGEWLTNQVRSLWAAEQEPIKAMTILRDGFPDMEEQDRLAILMGHKKLVGSSRDGLDLLEDDATEIDGFSLSLDAVLRQQDNSDEVDRWRDLFELATDQTEQVASPAGLVKIPRRKNRAYRRGEVTIDDIPYRENRFGPTALPSKREPQEGEPEEEPLELPTPDDHISHHYGWLTPDGKFYRCGWMEHLYIVGCFDMTGEQAEQAGWIKISDKYAWSTYHLHGTGRPPTQRQIDLVFDWCTANNHKIPDWVKERA